MLAAPPPNMMRIMRIVLKTVSKVWRHRLDGEEQPVDHVQQPVDQVDSVTLEMQERAIQRRLVSFRGLEW